MEASNMVMNPTSAFFATVALLTTSNIFMTFAWYGHLKFQNHPMYVFILVSWGIAFFEYCFQVPGNRIGHQFFSAVELKATQEVITMLVFIAFSIIFLGEPIRWNHCLGLGLIVVGASVVFYK
jgi:uncharacterized protein (DUF486 family)